MAAQCRLWATRVEDLLGGKLPSEAFASEAPAPLGPSVTRLVESLLQAEKLDTLARLAGCKLSLAPLDHAWRQTLFVQSLGRAEEEWSVDVQICWQEARWLGRKVQEEAARSLARKVNTASASGAVGDGASLLVINTSGESYTGPCVARVTKAGALANGFELVTPSGRLLPFETLEGAYEDDSISIKFTVREVPGFGFNTYSLRPEASERSPMAVGAEPIPDLTAVQTGLHLGPLRPTHAFLSNGDPAVKMRAVATLHTPCPAGNEEFASQEGLVLSLRETGGGSHELALAPSLPAEEAWLVDDLGQRGRALRVVPGKWKQPPRVLVELGPREEIRVAVRMKFPEEESAARAPQAETPRAVFARFWEHNAGAAPEGNLPLGLWTEGRLARGENTRFPICLSNDTTDREYVGSVQLYAPEAWTLLPRRIPFRVGPRSQALFEAMIVVPGEAPACFLRAETWDGYRVVRDVLPIGEVQPLELSLFRWPEAWVLRTTNPNGDHIEGEAAVVLEGREADPTTQPLRLAGGETAELLFPGSGSRAVAKVTWYGHVQYAQAEG